MKITLAGGYDTQNLGDYGSFLGLYKLVKRHFSNANFSVLSRHPRDAFRDEFDVKTVLNLDHQNKKAARGRIFNGFNESDDNSHLRTILAELGNADLLLFGNGRLFVDISLGFMSGPLNYFALLTVLARFLGKPIVLSSVTLVHPSSTEGKELLGFILRNADLILVREQSSADVAKEYIARSGKVVVLPDIAFAVTPEDACNLGLPDFPRGSVGVNFRGVNYLDEISDTRVEKIASKLVELVDHEDCDLVFCHQCTYDIDEKIVDDRYMNKRVYDVLPAEYQRRCLVFSEKWSLAQTLGIYGKLQRLVTERRHGFILSLTQGTPAALICNEPNSSVVAETVPLKDTFLKPDESLTMKNNYAPLDVDWLDDIRRQLDEYPRQFLKLVEAV